MKGTYRVDEHVSFEFGVVKKSFLAALKVALEKFVAVHGHVLLQRRSVTENFSTAFKMAFEGARHTTGARSDAGHA